MSATQNEIERELNLSVELIGEGRPNRPGAVIAPEWITIRFTGGGAPGEDAPAYSRFVRQTGFFETGGRRIYASRHLTVDDECAIRHLPLGEMGLHAGACDPVSLGVGICGHGGVRPTRADERAALLVAVLLQRLGLGVERVVPHGHWSEKADPAPDFGDWGGFIVGVATQLNRLPFDFDAAAALAPRRNPNSPKL